MTYFEWDPALETGNEVVDAQHKGLFELANALERALDDDTADEDMVADAVYGLCGYVVEHFHDEDALMVAYHYPGVGPHRALHEQLAAETLDLMSRFVNGEELAPAQLAPLVCDWLTGHIMQQDMAVIEHVERIEAAAREAASRPVGQR